MFTHTKTEVDCSPGASTEVVKKEKKATKEPTAQPTKDPTKQPTKDPAAQRAGPPAAACRAYADPLNPH